MTRLLLDTSAFLWWLGDDPALGTEAPAAIASSANEVLVSVASLWEIVVKTRIGKLEAELDTVLDVSAHGFTHLPIREPHLRVLGDLPSFHRDPFDHLLIAQSIAEEATFVTADRHAGLYPGRTLPSAR